MVQLLCLVLGDAYKLTHACGLGGVFLTGHTKEYHNHESLICLYDDAASGHSTKVGEALDGKSIYGKYEDTNKLPLLDACSAHFGNTPDSTDATIYHYHVQDAPPFVVGCFGPNDDESLVTVAQCRGFYTGCGDGDEQTFTTADGSFDYDMWCPCFDANGSNIGTIEELEVFSGKKENTAPTSAPTAAPTATPTAAPTAAPTPAPEKCIQCLVRPQCNDDCTGECVLTKPTCEACGTATCDEGDDETATCTLSNGKEVKVSVPTPSPTTPPT